MDREVDARWSAMRRFILRAIVFTTIFTIGVLVDEYLKEGYWFKVNDVAKVPTHESLICASWVIALIASICYWVVTRR